MHQVALGRPDDLEGFRAVARRLLAAGVSPERVLWRDGEGAELFGIAPPSGGAAVTVPAPFIRLAEDVICHRDSDRLALLYQASWRLTRGERALLEVPSDPLVHRLERMAKAVRRDLHKMHALVRFRRVQSDGGEHFVAWFEPDHHILRRAAPFFVGRFASMRWSILTPAGTLHWDGRVIAFGEAVPREQAPREDELDDWWRTYYRAMFNPARANPQALRTEMPKKYWRNLPEAALIPEMVADAATRMQAMLEAEPAAPRRRIRKHETRVAAVPPNTLASLAAQAGACERCPLHGSATRIVFGEGPASAPVVLVGEQPGDEEDLAGRPFVGPAGRMLDRALVAAGIDRTRLYLTNAVKHFKFVPRGKRRMHQTPSSYEIQRCGPWLEQELDLIRPRLAVALGATAARALTGQSVSVLRERGRVLRPQSGPPVLVTVHPAFLLRLPDAAAREREFGHLVADLRQLGTLVPEVRSPRTRGENLAGAGLSPAAVRNSRAISNGACNAGHRR